MKKIIFACPWGKDKKRAWSGTYFGLYQELSELYDIEDFELSFSSKNVKDIFLKCYYKFKNKYVDFGVSKNRYYNALAMEKYSGNNAVCIQFSECPDVYGLSSFVYQDLHVGYLKKMMNNMPEIFEVSAFQNLPAKAINRREKIQREFYDKVVAVFTMGKWLRKELIDEYGLDENKVFHVGGVQPRSE